MRGVILCCLLYACLPVTVLWVLSLASSGFPIFPLIVGLGLAYQKMRER
jgi:hypothetical protein